MFAPFLVGVTLARAVVSMLPVGLFFAAAADPTTASRSIGLASWVTLGSGLGLWPVGRLLDRVGPWRGVRFSILAAAASLLVLSGGVAWSWPWPLLVVIGMVSGVSLAPLAATPRALLPGVVVRTRLVWASGVEATSYEVALIVAPVVAAVAGRGGAAVVLLIAAGGLGATWMAFPRRADVGGDRAGSGPLVTGTVARLAGLAALLGLSGGLLEPGLAALPPALPRVAESTALLFVAMGLGSAAGGLLAARTGWPHNARHAAPLFALHALALVGAAVVDGVSRLFALTAAGLPIAPLTSLAGLHLDRWAGPRRASETYGLVTSALLVATGLGQAAAARLIVHVPAVRLVLLAAVPPLLAAALIRYRHGRRPG